MRWAVAAVLLMGCDAVFLPEERATCAGQAGPNNTGLFRFCSETDPVGERSLLSQVSTDDDCDALVTAGSDELCVVTAVKLTIGAGVKAVGARPLVLFATQTIVLGGALSVSSRGGEPRPAGANATTCDVLAAAAPPDNATDGGGGGAGGSLELDGAPGGIGAGSTPGAMPKPGAALGTIRGGCPGGPGGPGGAMTKANIGGDGGGALYLVAGEAITIAGTLEASGGGGLGSLGSGTNTGGPGGGGGGSGGLIALDAPSITLQDTARLVANGGAGGGGAGPFNATGQAGATADPAAAFPFDTIGGNGGGSNGGRGGAGGTALQEGLRGIFGMSGTGGGGGGGAVGVIRVFTTRLVDNGALVSPAY